MPDPSTSSGSRDEPRGESSGAGAESGRGTRDPVLCPRPPDGLTRWSVGSDADADVDPTGPQLILMGGGPDVDEAFAQAFVAAAGGDAVVLRASGGDGYNDYFAGDIGGLDSVETLLVDEAHWADDPYVSCRVAQAEVVFIAGGDQARYMSLWKDTALADAVMTVYDRGGVIGGTSAGLAVLGEYVFAAYEGTVYPDEVLADPYNPYMTMDRDLFAFDLLQGVITDSHFYERDRMARLVGFAARIVTDGWNLDPVAIGVDEATALVIGPDGVGEVVGDGYVYVAFDGGVPQTCVAGQPLTYEGLRLLRLTLGDTVTLPAASDPSVASDGVGASDGELMPSNPY